MAPLGVKFNPIYFQKDVALIVKFFNTLPLLFYFSNSPLNYLLDYYTNSIIKRQFLPHFHCKVRPEYHPALCRTEGKRVF